jgi:hypothetical protein
MSGRHWDSFVIGLLRFHQAKVLVKHLMSATAARRAVNVFSKTRVAFPAQTILYGHVQLGPARVKPYTNTTIRLYAMAANNARRFAPLARASSSHETQGNGGDVLRGVIFDMDGTLCEPQNYMFGQMRSALGIDKGTDILDHVYSLPEPQQTEGMEKIRAIEREAMSLQKPQPGLDELMSFLDSKAILKAICTRNFEYVFSSFWSSTITSVIV